MWTRAWRPPLSPPLVAGRVPPSPALSMLGLERVATRLAGPPVGGRGRPPPLGFVPNATVTAPVKLGSVLPALSFADTCTGGEIVLPAVVALGCTVNTRCVAGAGGGGAVPELSASTVASHVLDEEKYQFNIGWTGPVVAGTMYSASLIILASDCVARSCQGGDGGLSAPAGGLAIVTA